VICFGDGRIPYLSKGGLQTRPSHLKETTMKTPKKIVLALIGFLALAAVGKGILGQAQTDSPAARELTAILKQFMIDAARGNAAGFDSFSRMT
jgi:hypothetical protein